MRRIFHAFKRGYMWRLKQFRNEKSARKTEIATNTENLLRVLGYVRLFEMILYPRQ